MAIIVNVDVMPAKRKLPSAGFLTVSPVTYSKISQALTINMKRTLHIFILSIPAAMMILCPLDLSAQKKSRSGHYALDGSQVNVYQEGPAVPIENRLKQNTEHWLDFEPSKIVYLYPYGQNEDQEIEENGVKVTEGPLESNGIEVPESIGDGGFIFNVSDSARIDIYIPSNPNGQMVICCPGGGYGGLSVLNEGQYVAKWMNDRGIACAVAKYRLPNGHHKVPLQDIQNAFSYCRHFAKDWGIEKIGIMGFSAGGHLAASASTLYVDAATRPDFSILVYPVISTDPKICHQGSVDNLIGKKRSWTNRKAAADSSFDAWQDRTSTYKKLLEKYSLEKQVSPDTPPTFIVFSSDDMTAYPENELLYYRALISNNVQCEMHAFPLGGHGYGFQQSKYTSDPLNPANTYITDFRTDFFNSMERFLNEL